MDEALRRLIAQAESLAKKGEPAAALTLGQNLIERYPNEFEVWALLGYLHARENAFHAALHDLSLAIRLNDREPSLFFDRGRYFLNVAEWESAAQDFTAGLALCDYYKSDYYRETLYFLRAEARLRQGRCSDALVDLDQVGDGFTFWTYHLVSKSEMLAQCLSCTRPAENS